MFYFFINFVISLLKHCYCRIIAHLLLNSTKLTTTIKQCYQTNPGQPGMSVYKRIRLRRKDGSGKTGRSGQRKRVPPVTQGNHLQQGFQIENTQAGFERKRLHF